MTSCQPLLVCRFKLNNIRRTCLVVQKKPDMGSVDVVSGLASRVAPALMARRTTDQLKPCLELY